MGTVHLLIVEDDPVYLKVILKEISTHAEIEPTVARSLSDALTKVAESDAVLLELNLSDSEGLETFSAMQRSSPEIPILVMSSVTGNGAPMRALEMGAQDYIAKGDETPNSMVRSVLYAIKRGESDTKILHYLDGVANGTW